MPKDNFAAAFVEYCKGTSLDDISMALAIPISRLKARCHNEGWALLVPSMPVVPTVNNAERAQEKLNENRERNLRIARALQEDLFDVVQKLRDGELKVARAFANGREVEMEPSLRDRADLANYARTVADLSYRALGDVEPSKNAPGDAASSGAQQITIILPPAVSAPRSEKPVDVDSEVVTPERPALLGEGS